MKLILLILIILVICQLNIINILLYNTLYRLYYVSNNNKISFKFNHGKVDGQLSLNLIKRYLLKNNISSLANNLYIPQYLKLYPYQYSGLEKFSDFNKIISSYIYKFIKRKNISKLNIGVLVSKRHLLKNNNQLGNYIKFACYTVYKNMSLYEICSLHHVSVRREKHNQDTYMTLFNNFNILNVDLFINSWAELSEITVKNSKLFLKYNFIPKKEFYQKELELKKFISISKHNNIWFVSNITLYKKGFNINQFLKY